MRLKYLWIQNFKNLKDFTIDFEKGDGLTMLIGTNGSGKSNILEAISTIFSGLRNSKNSPSFGYTLTYTLDENIGASVEIKIDKYPSNSTKCFVNGISKTKKHLIENKLMPSKVIALYSGEENRLWQDYYEPHYESFKNEIIQDKQINSQYMTFVDKHYWNIALLVLSTLENEKSREFIKNEIGIRRIDKISFSIDMNKYTNWKNSPIMSFIELLSPNKHGLAEKTFEECQDLFIKLSERSGIDDTQRFERLSQALISELLKSIEITFDGSLSVKSLSEGEKKLILVKAVLEIVADSNALIMLDEPDSHIHESRKKELLDMLEEYKQYDRQIVLTSHSPTLADSANGSGIFMLKEMDDGSIESFDADRLERIKHLTGSRLSAFSDLPILLVEGKTDIIILQKVLKYFKENIEGYENTRLDFDMYSFGGTGDALFWYDRFYSAFIGRPIERRKKAVK